MLFKVLNNCSKIVWHATTALILCEARMDETNKKRKSKATKILPALCWKGVAGKIIELIIWSESLWLKPILFYCMKPCCWYALTIFLATRYSRTQCSRWQHLVVLVSFVKAKRLGQCMSTLFNNFLRQMKLIHQTHLTQCALIM